MCAELWRWPVKSMAGERVGALRVDERGAGGDRTHAVLHEHKGEWRPLTAREAPRLLAWRAGYPSAGRRDAGPGRRRRSRWSPRRTARAAGWGDAAAAHGARRRPRPPRAAAPRPRRDPGPRPQPAGHRRGDAGRARAPSSARELDLRRFRPNLHLELDARAVGGARLGGRAAASSPAASSLELLHPCERCAIPTRDPDTQREVARSCCATSRASTATLFGINARVLAPGRIADGEAVRLATLTLQDRGARADKDSPLLPTGGLAVLRIDETSKTLVAPQAGGLVTEANPDRDELLALLGGLLGGLRRGARASEPAPGGHRARARRRPARVRRAGRPRRRRPGDRTTSSSARSAARSPPPPRSRAGTPPRSPPSTSRSSAAVPGDSPQVVLIAGGFDAATVATVEWLARRHGVEVSLLRRRRSCASAPSACSPSAASSRRATANAPDPGRRGPAAARRRRRRRSASSRWRRWTAAAARRRPRPSRSPPDPHGRRRRHRRAAVPVAVTSKRR